MRILSNAAISNTGVVNDGVAYCCSRHLENRASLKMNNLGRPRRLTWVLLVIVFVYTLRLLKKVIC